MLRSLRWRFAPLLAALAIVMVALIPAVAAAQEAPRFKRLTVSIWPEYDEPSVFVNYEGELAEGVALPATLNLALPLGVQVNSACEIDAAGRHTVVDWREITGDKPGVSYVTGKPHTHIEFYYNPIEGAGRRESTYKVVAPGPVDALQVEIQQPLRSTNFVVAPAANSVFADKEGFKYHRYDFANVAAGQTLTFDIAYEKPDAKPSVERQQTAPATAATAAGSEYALPLLLLGLGLVGIAVFLLLRSRERPRARLAAAPAVSRRRNGARAGANTAGAEPTRYCTQCGGKIRAGAAFWTSCGQPVRRRD